MEHEFTPVILGVLKADFKKKSEDLYKVSLLIQYLNIKTRSASRGSKARSSFGNIYALYVLIEDYLKHNYHKEGDYSKCDGVRFSDLFQRQRQMPFGAKLQNHHLNHRLNEEFHKYFPTCEFTPILREVATKRYWINENLLKLKVGDQTYNVAGAIIKIIDAYIAAKKDAFEQFIEDCEGMLKLEKADPGQVKAFLIARLQPNVDARVFEIVSYSILKEHYGAKTVFWGWSLDAIKQEGLVLYKTGRTNANDGGIDFVMRPLGRFFQVTETIDVKKYFLDIDKIQRFPLTFVVKSSEDVPTVRARIEAQARRVYSIDKIVKRYMNCIEEIINIPILLERFNEVLSRNALGLVISEIVLQSKVEFNYEEEEEASALDVDTLVDKVKKARGRKKPLGVAELKKLKDEHAQTIVPLRTLAAEARTLERQVADLVHAVYGLTSEDVALMWKTAPPRMPGEAPAGYTGLE